MKKIFNGKSRGGKKKAVGFSPDGEKGREEGHQVAVLFLHTKNINMWVYTIFYIQQIFIEKVCSSFSFDRKIEYQVCTFYYFSEKHPLFLTKYLKLQRFSLLILYKVQRVQHINYGSSSLAQSMVNLSSSEFPLSSLIPLIINFLLGGPGWNLLKGIMLTCI